MDAACLAVIVEINFLLMESWHSFHVRIHSLLRFSETTLIETLPYLWPSLDLTDRYVCTCLNL